MATVIRENIGVLTDKLVVSVSKEDYLPAFEKAIKDYSKKANIPGFRKGMVPVGMVKKMYGAAVFNEEVIKSVEKGLTDYMTRENLEIFGQPLPMEENDPRKLDMNNPSEYTFSFEIGLKQDFALADLPAADLTNYKVAVTDAMVDEAIEGVRVVNKTPETHEHAELEESAETAREEAATAVETEASSEAADIPVTTAEAVATTEAATAVEKAELNEEFFKKIFPDKEITTEEDFRNEVKTQIQAQWDSQSKNQLMDQVYHKLLDNTSIAFPEEFLKRWMQNGTDKPKTAEEVEKEFPSFVNQLKWSLITEKVVKDNNIEVTPEEISDFARYQLFSYMRGMGGSMEDMMQQPWVTEYVQKMMKDRKFVEETYHRIQTDKVFSWAETQIKPVEKGISVEDFNKMQEAHSHHH